MWHTSKGVRTLQGAEATLISTAVEFVWDFLEIESESPEDQWSSNVPVFDALDCHQRIVQLSFVASALLRDDVPPPPLNAVNEGTVGMLFEVIGVCIEWEVDGGHGGPSAVYPSRRQLVLDVAAANGRPSDARLPGEGCDDLDEWELLLEMLSDAILWDDAWIDDGFITDVDPETADARKERLGIDDGYYLAVVPDSCDSELERARRTLRDLIADN